MGQFSDGLRKFQKKVEDITRRAEKMDGSRVTLPEMLTGEFMARNTDFKSAQEMFDSSGIEMETDDDVVRVIKTPEWNAFVASRTRFASWDAMVKTAANEWALRQLRDK